MSIITATHQYEFPSENPVVTFGAGWTLAGSVTRPLFFNVGTSLDDIIAQFNMWQDVDTATPLTKEIVLHQIEYTRSYGTDVVTITYPLISSTAALDITVVGNITEAERAAFIDDSVGTGWTVTNEVYHAVVTLITPYVQKSHMSTNPRFMCGLEAIAYTRTPGAVISPTPAFPTTPILM